MNGNTMNTWPRSLLSFGFSSRTLATLLTLSDVLSEHTPLDDHVPDGHHIGVVQTLEDLDLPDGRHGHLHSGEKLERFG